MKTTIKVNADGSKSFEITDASISEIQQLMSDTPARKNVVETTTDALATTSVKATKRKYTKRHIEKHEWTADEMEFIGRLSLQLGPNAKSVGNTIASALQSREGNVRKFITLNRMSHYVYRYLKTGFVSRGLATKNVADLNSRGFTGGMLQNLNTTSNHLGDVRRIPVLSA